MTNADLIEIGFIEFPHPTIMNSVVYDLGRNRHLSVGCVGTPNEMIFICEQDKNVPEKNTDLICLKNYDYDGYTTIETIKELIKLLKPKK